MQARTVPTHRIAILAPMRSELRPLVAPLGLGRRESESALLWGMVGRVEVVAALTGIGMDAGARAVLHFPLIQFIIRQEIFEVFYSKDMINKEKIQQFHSHQIKSRMLIGENLVQVYLMLGAI